MTTSEMINLLDETIETLEFIDNGETPTVADLVNRLKQMRATLTSVNVVHTSRDQT